MPVYPYQCSSCGVSVEVIRSIHDDEQVPSCPACEQAMIRVWEPTPVKFTGGGFYSTGG